MRSIAVICPKQSLSDVAPRRLHKPVAAHTPTALILPPHLPMMRLSSLSSAYQSGEVNRPSEVAPLKRCGHVDSDIPPAHHERRRLQSNNPRVVRLLVSRSTETSAG